jgi:MFS family permease
MDSLKPQPEIDAEVSLRRTLRLVTTAWIFGSAWTYLTTGAAMTRYAQSLGMSRFGFGLLAAIPFAGALVQLPASYLLERYGGRRRLFIIAGLIHRATWLAIAAVPWVTPAATWWWMLLLVLAFSTVMANLMGPAWMTWLADMVPGRLRGRYFSARGQYGRMVGLVTTTLVGLALDSAEAIDPVTLRRVISGVMAIAAVCGVLDISLFRWVPDTTRRPHDPNVKLGELLRAPLRDPNFRRYLGFNATLTFAVGYVGQFIWLYLFDVVELTNVQANTMLVAVPLLMHMVAFPIWGRLVDRLGCRPVLLIAGMMIVHGGASWIFVTRESWWLGYIGSITATAAWPGVELASLNILLELSGSKQAGRRGSAYVAVNSIVVATAGVASGLFGGAMAQWFGNEWRGSLMGWPITYHGLLLLISAALRASALLWLIGLREPGAYTARAALRFMTANIYSNLQQAVLMPARGVVRLGRFTYKLLPQRDDRADSDER